MHWTLKATYSIVLPSVFFFYSSGNMFAQTRPSGEKGGIELDENAPRAGEVYKMSIKVRPLSWLITPLSAGNTINLNGKIDFVLNRKLSLAIEGNYLNDSGGFMLEAVSGSRYSLRVDLNSYFLDDKNPKKYAEGIHIGPYFKYRYSDLVNWGGQETETAFFIGGLCGFQVVGKRTVIDPHFGLGLGILNSSLNGSLPMIDARIGFSIGLVVH